MSQLADALRHKKGGSGSDSWEALGSYEVTHFFCSHSVVLGFIQPLKKNG